MPILYYYPAYVIVHMFLSGQFINQYRRRVVMRRESFLSLCTSIALAVVGFVICANNAMAVDHYVRADADNPVRLAGFLMEPIILTGDLCGLMPTKPLKVLMARNLP